MSGPVAQNHSDEKERKKSANMQCPYCPCEFVTQHDYESHMKAFGTNLEEHTRRFREHGRVERGDSESQ